ncbi:uncharacterized protein [Cherax quadricarinatus]|uniref:uncharacterized protein n=1 Tax=Cherax quadricarinatus TaxID=27406 RepID=UPI00387E9A5F
MTSRARAPRPSSRDVTVDQPMRALRYPYITVWWWCGGEGARSSVEADDEFSNLAFMKSELHNPSKMFELLNPSKMFELLNPARCLNFSTPARGLNFSTPARYLNFSTPARCLNFSTQQDV